MYAKIFIDFCPSESLGGAEKYPESPFTAAGCVLVAPPGTEEKVYAEICHHLGRIKTARLRTKARLQAMAFLREKIENEEVGVFALCVHRTEIDMFAEGAINCMDETKAKLVEGLPIHSAGKAGVREIAEELGIHERTVISTVATLLMSHYCAVYFLELFQKLETFRGGEIRVILDTLPGISKHKFEKFQAISSRILKLPHEYYLNHYGSTVVYEPLGNQAAKPCGLLIADLFAHAGAAVIDSIRSPGDNSPPTKRSPQLPKYNDKDTDKIRDFLNFMLHNSYLLMTTPEMLMAIINEGGKIRDKIFAAQAKFGLEFPNYLDPSEFLSPEARGLKKK